MSRFLKCCFSVIFLFTAIPHIQSQIKTIPYQELPTSSGAPSGSNMYFGATMNAATATVTFAGPADRWIAIGIGSMMTGTDPLIYSSGHAIFPHPVNWQDYHINSYNTSGVIYDINQNWTILSNSVALGQRTVVATRPLNTGDIDDAVINFSATSLSVVWARGAAANYTIAYHGSVNRANNITLPWLTVPSASFATATSSLCSGSAITYSNLSSGGQLSYTWNFGGGTPLSSTLTNPAITYTSPGTYSVSLIASNAIGSHTFSQLNYITVNPTVAPVVAISLSSGQNPSCAGAPLSFSASSLNGGAPPVYQWQVNGQNVGGNTPVFTANNFTTNSSVSCIMTSAAQCSNPQTVTSSPITLTVNSTAAASVSIAQITGFNPMCSGALASFSATAFNGGSLPAFQWKVNGTNAGSNTTTYTSLGLSNADIVTCELSSNSACASSTFGISNGITMTVSAVLVPSVTVVMSGTNPVCQGVVQTFTALPFNGGTSPAYQWQINGANVGANNPLFSTSTLSNGDVLTCFMTSGFACSSPSVVSSSGFTATILLVPPPPVITPSATVFICAGNSVTVTSSATSGNNWSNGASTPALTLTTSGSYSVSQTSNGCTSPYSLPLVVVVNPLPVCSVNFPDPFCRDDSPATLQGFPAGGQFVGTGVMNGLSFNPSHANFGNNLVVYSYTDNNTCSDTVAFYISVSECVSIQSYSNNDASVSIFPNPFSEEVLITTTNACIKAMQVTNIDGKQQACEVDASDGTYTFSLKDAAPGIYFITIEFPHGIRRYKILKSN